MEVLAGARSEERLIQLERLLAPGAILHATDSNSNSVQSSFLIVEITDTHVQVHLIEGVDSCYDRVAQTGSRRPGRADASGW